MKKIFAFCLVLLLLVPAANAAETGGTSESSNFTCECSDWAHDDVVKALDLKLVNRPDDANLRSPIDRDNFAVNAASLVAIEFGSHLESYLDITNCRKQAASGEIANQDSLDVAKNLGIIQGRENGNLDTGSNITRQEAAAMLARTYLAYHNNEPDSTQPHLFADQSDIADWAMYDVQLVNQLGIMTGLDDGRFDPQGSYTKEQCIVTLMRLYEKCPYDGSKKENPFAIPVIAGGIAKNRDDDYLPFYIETDKSYIFPWIDMGYTHGSGYIIKIIDQDLSIRSYHTAIITRSNCQYSSAYAKPENAFVSEDGTKLIYTSTLKENVYYNGSEDLGVLVQQRGIYTVTMDLATGEQTYTRICI
jgi:hypothetical protein